MLHATVASYIETQLTALGWTTPGSTPFGAPVLTYISTWPQEWQTIAQLQPGTFAITIGDEQDSTPEELGGVLVVQEIPIFCDMFMDNEGTALALACDVRDIVKGRLSGTVMTLALKDFTASTPTDVPGWSIELGDVVREVPLSTAPQWQVVKVTASCYFNEVRGD